MLYDINQTWAEIEDTLEEHYVLILMRKSRRNCISVTMLVSPLTFPGLCGCSLHWSWTASHHCFWVELCCLPPGREESATVPCQLTLSTSVGQSYFLWLKRFVLRHWWQSKSLMEQPSVVFYLGRIRENRSLSYNPFLFLHRFTIFSV